MKNKEFDWRMQGMAYAWEITQKDGIEGLEREIKRRNITKLPMTVTQAEVNRVWHELTENMYNNITTTFLYVLVEKMNINEDDLVAILDMYNETVRDCLDMDFLGEHYVRMEDYAVELNSKLGLHLDVNRIAACQDHYDENNDESEYHKVKIEKIIKLLEDNNYIAASNFLKRKTEI